MNKLTLPFFSSNDVEIDVLSLQKHAFVEETETKLLTIKDKYYLVFRIYDSGDNRLSNNDFKVFKKNVISEIAQMIFCLKEMNSYECITNFQKKVQKLIQVTLKQASSVPTEREAIIDVTQSLIDLNRLILNRVIDLSI